MAPKAAIGTRDHIITGEAKTIPKKANKVHITNDSRSQGPTSVNRSSPTSVNPWISSSPTLYG